jgi:hypothetical protein
MQQYQDLIKTVLETGSWQDNRTGIRTLSVPGAMMRFDLANGNFPAVTTKKLAFKSVIGELCAFLRASRNAAEFRALGCKVWDQNANENAQWLANPYREGEDDLGPVYGVQWRQWPAYKLLDADRPAQIADAQANGFTLIAPIVEDGVQSAAVQGRRPVARMPDTIMTIPAAAASCSTAGIRPCWTPSPCPPATCCTSSSRTPARAKSRCAYMCAATISAWARPSTSPKGGPAAPGGAPDGLHATLVHVFHRRRTHL